MEDAQAPVVLVDQRRPELGAVPVRPGRPAVLDLRERPARERLVAGVRHESMERTDRVDSGKLLVPRAVPCRIAAHVDEAVVHVHAVLVQSDPRLHGAFRIHVAQRPLLGHALDVERLAVVALGDHRGPVVVHVAGLDWIPIPARIGRMLRRSGRDERVRSAVVRLLEVPPQVVDVDDALVRTARAQVVDRATAGEPDTDAQDAVVQIAGLGAQRGRIGQDGDRQNYERRASCATPRRRQATPRSGGRSRHVHRPGNLEPLDPME